MKDGKGEIWETDKKEREKERMKTDEKWEGEK